MKLHCAARIVVGCSLLQLAARAPAADPKGADPDLPQPLDFNVAQPMLESSPFTRAINLSDKLALTGIAYVKGKPVATLTDKTTKQNYLVSEEPNALGWRLAEASASTELRFTQIKLMVGAEVVIIRYGDAQLTPSSKGGTASGKFPPDSEVIRMDENGKPYVRGSAYLSDADRERYYRGWSHEAHDKFRDIIRGNRERMFAWGPVERAAFSKKVFDAIDAEDRARQKK